jgi:hypothetical protein
MADIRWGLDAYTPVLDGEATWYLHSSHSEMSRERYVDHLQSGL